MPDPNPTPNPHRDRIRDHERRHRGAARPSLIERACVFLVLAAACIGLVASLALGRWVEVGFYGLAVGLFAWAFMGDTR